jgi:aminoglycoside 6'-N-acetyltransferase
MIALRELKDSKEDYLLLQKWCSNKNVYEWFEQRILSLDEITKKYKKKLDDKKQKLFIIQLNNKDIGYTQIYKFENDINFKDLNKYKYIYEFDTFIGEEEYLSRGYGTSIIKEITKIIYSNYEANAIILRPFKRNIRAVKCYQKCEYDIIDEYEGKDSLDNKETILILLNKKNTNN